jgi:hypothetical protein
MEEEEEEDEEGGDGHVQDLNLRPEGSRFV